MQIREITLKELYEVYDELVKKSYDITYDTFEDRIYEMREWYKMIGVFERERLLAYAGMEIKTTLKDGRHIRLYEMVALDEKSEKELKSYLEDYAKISMATKILKDCA